MHSAHYSEGLHAVVAKLERNSLDKWRIEHAPADTIIDALAAYCESVLTEILRRPGGNVSVTVSVICSRPWMNEHYYFSLQKRRKVWHVNDDRTLIRRVK